MCVRGGMGFGFLGDGGGNKGYLLIMSQPSIMKIRS